MNNMIIWWIILLLISGTTATSFNQPKYCPSATWNATGITFANSSFVTSGSYGIFINRNNTVYLADCQNSRLITWIEGSTTPTIENVTTNSYPYSIFVTITEDIYIVGGSNVYQWALNSTSVISSLYIGYMCLHLFIDSNNSLYCSAYSNHKIVKRSLNSNNSQVTTVAGTGCSGVDPAGLYNPRGIFVDINFNLYVADYGNHRIQLFPPGKLNATTVAGIEAPGTITLQYPTDVILDADRYLFIVDCNNDRIIGSDLNGFRCIAGCSGFGSSANQLYYPQSMAFDSYGNIFVIDSSNLRIQKFLLATNSCNTTTISQQNSTISANTVSSPTNIPVTPRQQSISYNRPKLDPFACWSPNAITLANSSVVGSYPFNVFVDLNNTVYVATYSLNRIVTWPQGTSNASNPITATILIPMSLFVTSSGDLYVDNTYNYGRVDKFTLNATNSTPAMFISNRCYGIFVDLNNTLYCSLYSLHQIIAKSLDDVTDAKRIVAGTGCYGSGSDALYYPWGIFVDSNFSLYVADSWNSRIQLFHSGQLNGTTVAGASAPGTITLSYPSGVILDAGGYLFITDRNNHRLIGSGPNGFRCIAGCSNSTGAASNQLYYPMTMAFDSDGNIYVADSQNSRIQKFTLLNNTCNTTTSSTSTTTSTSTTSTTATTATTSITPSNQSCFAPMITLIPSTSSLSAPLQYRRNQDFFISSYLSLDCNTSLATTAKWTVSNCTLNCIFSIQLDQTIVTTSSEIYIPAKTLDYGVYQLTLTVAMVAAPQLISSVSAFVKITASGVTANLIAYGTSMITRGYQQDLLLDPGKYSVDPDTTIFNATNWNYEYYCRIYGHYNFPNNRGKLLTIGSSIIDHQNPSCLSNGTRINGSNQSSLIIPANSLQSNRTYQFMVIMNNSQSSTSQATGCVISTLCSPNMEYQFVNPTTQVALFSLCSGTCPGINNIIWTVYSGVMNSSSRIVQWTPFNQMTQYQDSWFFGYNTSNFTSLNNLFLLNSSIEYWRFQVMYSFSNDTASSSLNFIINQPPENGNCSIDPLNGTTSTIFTISCSNWTDQDGIQDYSFYSWTTDPADRSIVAFSSVSTIEVRLPAGTGQTSLVYVVAFIEDTLNCITEFNLSSVVVRPDIEQIMNLVAVLQNSENDRTNNPLVQILSSGNQNMIGQIITSVSQQFNKINSQAIENAVASGIPASNIVVSSLDSRTQGNSWTSINSSALNQYNKQLNTYASVREYLIGYTTNLVVTTTNSIKLQASSLVQITQATNQLTRTTITSASDKCYQLASALYSIAGTIPYEDIQVAAKQIVQCANNVLNAINGPLQQRTIVLDLDSSRSNALPTDYDTDVDSAWSNPNLFADGDDFSPELIAKNRNLYYQKQLANQISSQTSQTLSLLTSSLNIYLNLGQNLCMNTSSVFMSLETANIQSLSNKLIQQVENAQIQLPTNIRMNSTSSSISLRSMVQPLAVYGNSKSQSNTNLSRSISFSLFDQFGNEIPFQTNHSQPIELTIPRDPNVVIPSLTFQDAVSMSNTTHQQIFNLHFVNITNSLAISVHLEIHPLDTNLSYLFIYKFDSSPILNSSINQIDGWTVFCPRDLNADDIYIYFIDNTKTVNHQSVIFGLRELNETEVIDFCSNSSMISPPITNQPFNFTSNYELRSYTSGCYYLDSNNNWQSNGLIVSSRTNHYETQCLSTHLTTFASGFIVLPAPVNWNYVFANVDFNKNQTIYITLICVCTLYLLFMIYARYKDKKDLKKLGVTPLPDNQLADQYFYQILVFTGHRKDAGTRSKVHFILVGDQGETQVRTFADPYRTILQRGGIDAFIMTVPKTLGSLDYIHVWHDNTGSGASASWFLKYIIIRDLQTMEKSYFICQKWFAVEKDDGVIERVLPVAGECQKREFSYILSKHAYHSMTEGHLWLSIFSRPPSNKFTRIQRCTCCFVLLLTSMLLNILYYDQSAEAKSKTTNSLAFGPLYITLEQISIGVIVEILSFLPSILLIQLFRRIRPRRSHQSLQRAIYKIKQQPLPEKSIESPQTKRTSLTFPWWCLFVAYGLSLIFAGVSIFFIIVRGIEFGDFKTQKWLTSLLTGFFSSIFVIQPLKVLSLAIFFACFCRHTTNDKTAEEFITDDPIDLNDDEDYLHSKRKISPFTHRSYRRVHRLDQDEVQCARYQRIQEIQMWSILREFFSYLVFLSLLYFITYSNMNSNAFEQVQHLKNLFLNTRQIDHNYTNIKTNKQYWSWLENNFIENIRAQNWYNDQPPQYLRGFIEEKTNRLIGWPLMRQLRVKSDSCRINSLIDDLISSCNRDYSFSNEEKGSFQPGWMNQTIEFSNSSIQQAFYYQTGDELDTYVYTGNHHRYSSGGYAYAFRGGLDDLQGNLSELHRLKWIDQRTRAVLIQLSLYNPNSQLFTLISLLTEFLPTGGLETQSSFQPISFQIFTSISQLICLIIYMLFIVYLLIVEIQLFIKKKLKYLKNVWSLINLGIIGCSWGLIGVYIWLYYESNRISHLFAQTNGNKFINLQLSVYINDILIYLLGFCCFFTTIKFIRLCRFNQRLLLFIKTLEFASKELLSFAFMFSLIYIAFIALFYLLFVSQLLSCSSLYQTVFMLFQMILLNFDAYALSSAAAFLGPFCMSLFVFIVVFVCMSMFLTIINQNFRSARAHMKRNAHEDPQIFSFMFYKFQCWIGLEKANEFKQDVQYFHPIENFPDKIDQLLDALNRLYVDQ